MSMAAVLVFPEKSVLGTQGEIPPDAHVVIPWLMALLPSFSWQLAGL
jgi:hypothetical protein